LIILVAIIWIPPYSFGAFAAGCDGGLKKNQFSSPNYYFLRVREFKARRGLTGGKKVDIRSPIGREQPLYGAADRIPRCVRPVLPESITFNMMTGSLQR
jgi:hypothetical protein